MIIRKFYYLFFLILLSFFTSCSENNTTEEDFCKDVDCSGYGNCVVVDKAIASCVCDTGYHNDGLECIKDTEDVVCKTDSCVEENKTVCSVENNSIVCSCDVGYHEDGINCVENTEDVVCKTDSCVEENKTVCSVQNNSIVCSCDAGYHEDGINCVEDNIDLCDGIDCSGNGDCMVVDNEATCNCNYTHISWDKDCIEKIEFFNNAISENSNDKLDFLWDNYDGPIRNNTSILFLTRSSENEIIKLAGTFNSWGDTDIMTPVEFDRTFRYKIVNNTNNDKVYYKFIGNDWYSDPNNMFFDFNVDENSIVYPVNASRLAKIIVPSIELNNPEREIHIYFPNEYFLTNKKYSVLYMQDGDNIFPNNPKAIYGTWDVNLTADELISENLIDPIIIVGITTNARENEYLHTYVERVDNTPKLDLYIDYLRNILKPEIDNMFRTLPDKEHTAIAGSSFGGISSFFIAWQNSDIFSKVGVFSPSSWIGEMEELDPQNVESMRDLINSTVTMPNLKIYIDSGDTDFDGGQVYYSDSRGYTEYVRNSLIRNGWDSRDEWLDNGELIDYDENIDLSLVPTIFWSDSSPNGYSSYNDYLKPNNNLLHLVGHDQMHNEPSWKLRFKASLMFLFPKL
jgi:predicted alpha/beta superfamily hydrolase